MHRANVKRAENYTTPFLVTSGFFIFFSLWVILGLWGFFSVVLVAVGLDRLMLHLGR